MVKTGTGCRTCRKPFDWSRPSTLNNQRPWAAQPGCFARLLASGYGSIDRAANDAGVSILCIADDAGFVDIFAGEADVGGGRFRKAVLNRNGFSALAIRSDFAPLLRTIIFISEAALGASLNFKDVSLRLLAELGPSQIQSRPLG